MSLNQIVKYGLGYVSGNRGSVFVGKQELLDKGSLSVAGACTDRSGNIYITDPKQHIILKIRPDGYITLYAGQVAISGNDGNNRVQADEALFNEPMGIAADPSGNIYVADRGNNQIKKITPDRYVTLLAGSPTGLSGFKSGIGSEALFNRPNDVCVDNSGNIYVADMDNHSIRRIIPGISQVNTIAGNGQEGDAYGFASQFNTPYGITVDWSGKIFVMDSGNHKIKMIDRNLNVLRFSGTGVKGTRIGNADVCEYMDIKFADVDKSGNIYLIDSNEAESRLLTVNQNGTSAIVKDFPISRDDASIIAITTSTMGNGFLFVTESDYEQLQYSSSSSSFAYSSSSSSSSLIYSSSSSSSTSSSSSLIYSSSSSSSTSSSSSLIYSSSSSSSTSSSSSLIYSSSSSSSSLIYSSSSSSSSLIYSSSSSYLDRWNPADISTTAWYDASDISTITLGTGNTVAQWNDKSGNNYNMINNNVDISKPTTNVRTINGLNAILFNDQFIYNSANAPQLFPINQKINVFFVVDVDNDAGVNVFFMAKSNLPPLGITNFDSRNFRGYVPQDTTANILNAHLVTNPITAPSTPGWMDALFFDGTINNNQYSLNYNLNQTVTNATFLGVTQFDRSGSSMGISSWMNGGVVTESLYRSYAPQQNAATAVILGSNGVYPNNPAQKLNGVMGEVVIITGNLTTDIRNRMEGYLAWKWKLVGNLPSNHPYKNKPPYI